MTLQELEAKYGLDALVSASESSKVALKEAYEPESEELKALLGAIENTSSTAGTSEKTASEAPKTGKRRSKKSEVEEIGQSALAKAQAQQQQAQGKLVGSSQKAAKTYLTSRKREAKELGTQGNRVFTETLLNQQADGLEELATSFGDASAVTSAIFSQTYLELGEEEDDQSPLSGSGGSFALTF